jgi:integrase/recombinase XerD
MVCVEDTSNRQEPAVSERIQQNQISPLRRRMIEDMTVRNMSPATQRSYIHAVQGYSRHFGRSPERLGLQDVRAYQVPRPHRNLQIPIGNRF